MPHLDFSTSKLNESAIREEVEAFIMFHALPRDFTANPLSLSL